jgi:hypothetical protein
MIEIKKDQKEFNILARNIQEASRVREVREATGDKAVARSVTPDLAKRMTTVLATQRGSKVTVTCVLGDQESFQFASQVKQILQNSGWEVNGVNQAIYTQPVIGVFVKVKSQQYPRRVNSIVEAFKVLNITPDGILDPTLGADDVELIVGAKP